MRNASKNTIKRVVRQANELKEKGRAHPYRHFWDQSHLFWDVGGSIIIMTKGKVNNLVISGAIKSHIGRIINNN